MVSLPTGIFVMGSSDDSTEQPSHLVNVHAFALGQHVVTEAEWDACAAAGGCSYRLASNKAAPLESRPMKNLSWEDATQYIQWLQKITGKLYRLPTEAEWEYAARAGTTTRYDWGNQV